MSVQNRGFKTYQKCKEVIRTILTLKSGFGYGTKEIRTTMERVRLSSKEIEELKRRIQKEHPGWVVEYDQDSCRVFLGYSFK